MTAGDAIVVQWLGTGNVRNVGFVLFDRTVALGTAVDNLDISVIGVFTGNAATSLAAANISWIT